MQKWNLSLLLTRCMTRCYSGPVGTARAAVSVSKSRFIVTAGYMPDVAAARAFTAAVRADFPDADHHCCVFPIGYGASVTKGASDDGEPSGTAGRLMLAVLSRSHC